MKKIVVFVVVAAMVAIALVAFAQSPQPKQDVYTVQKGDTLWALEGAFSGNPMLWYRLVEMNLFLKSPGRTWVDEKGRTIVLVRPGERLNGLGELGIVPQPLPLDQLKAVAPPMPTNDQRQWWWLLLVMAALLLLWAIARMMRNPATAGPAMVPGGVTDGTVAAMFQENARRVYGDRVQVKNVVKGRGYGAIRISDTNRLWYTRLLTGNTVYRALVRRHEGSWTEEYMLQACGNDLRMSGARYIPGFGFRFVPEAMVAETPQPSAPQAAPTITATEGTTMAPATETPLAPSTAAPTAPTVTEPAPVEEDGKEFTFKPAAKTRPNFVEFKGFESFEVIVKDGKTTVRFS